MEAKWQGIWLKGKAFKTMTLICLPLALLSTVWAQTGGAVGVQSIPDNAKASVTSELCQANAAANNYCESIIRHLSGDGGSNPMMPDSEIIRAVGPYMKF